ncbi:MAG: DUF2062 domain-containing protein, partial [Bacteroidota bacterium]|nr:DUF2062 domain-containing protein [Bacteroidota bacterium]
RSGLRIYPVKPILSIKILSTKATCETELAARYSWRGGNIIEQESENEILDTTCISDSNIPVRQKLRKNLFSASLFIPAILYGLPRRIFHKLKNANLRKMWKEEVLGSNQNNSTLSKSLAFGIFMGLTPIWGWQTVLTLAGSHIMKLNKALAVIASYISLPPFMPIIMFASFYLGALVLGNTFNIDFSRGVNFDLISRNILQYIIGSIILAIAGGIITFLFSIILFKFFRKDKS